MGKVKAPLFSTRASGSIGGKITFAPHGKETVVKRIPTHPDAQSPPQLAQRAKFLACAIRWHALNLEEKAHCLVCADQLGITAYNYFQRECIAGRY